jgi:hypothetical protein
VRERLPTRVAKFPRDSHTRAYDRATARNDGPNGAHVQLCTDGSRLVRHRRHEGSCPRGVIIDDRNGPLKHIQRVQIILFSADRLPVLQVAHRAGVSRAPERLDASRAQMPANTRVGKHLHDRPFAGVFKCSILIKVE